MFSRRKSTSFTSWIKLILPICLQQLVGTLSLNLEAAKESGYFHPMEGNKEIHLVYGHHASTIGFFVDPHKYSFQYVTDTTYNLSMNLPNPEGDFGLSILVIQYEYEATGECGLRFIMGNVSHTVRRPRRQANMESIHEDHLLTTWDLPITRDNQLLVHLSEWKPHCQVHLIVTLHRLQDPSEGKECVNYMGTKEFTCGSLHDSRVLCISHEGTVNNHVPNCAQRSLPNSDEALDSKYWILSIFLNIFVSVVIFIIFVMFVRFIFINEWLPRQLLRRGNQGDPPSPGDTDFERPPDAPPSYFNIVKDEEMLSQIPQNPPTYNEAIRHI